jgi:hypothetical protein
MRICCDVDVPQEHFSPAVYDEVVDAVCEKLVALTGVTEGSVPWRVSTAGVISVPKYRVRAEQ